MNNCAECEVRCDGIDSDEEDICCECLEIEEIRGMCWMCERRLTVEAALAEGENSDNE